MVSKGKDMKYYFIGGLFIFLFGILFYSMNIFAEEVNITNDYVNDSWKEKEIVTPDNIDYISDNVISFSKEYSLSANSLVKSEEKDAIRKDSILLILDENLDSKAVAAALEGGDHYKENWDDSATIKLYSRIYYGTRKGKLNQTYTYMKSLNGGYKMKGANGTTIKKHFVRYSQSGFSEKTGGLIDQIKESSKYSPSKKTWSITPPSNWVAVIPQSGMGDVGCTYIIKYQRPNGDTFKHKLVNHIG